MAAVLQRNSREFLRVYQESGCDQSETMDVLGLDDRQWLEYSFICKQHMDRLEKEAMFSQRLTREMLQMQIYDIASDEDCHPAVRVKAYELLMRSTGFDKPEVKVKRPQMPGITPDLIRQVECEVFGIQVESYALENE